MVYKAVVVDKDYGSVSYEELQRVKEAYAAAGIELELAHYVTEDEIIEGCHQRRKHIRGRRVPSYDAANVITSVDGFGR